MAWAVHHGAKAPGGETQNIAIALVHGRGFADAHFVGSGPSAHVLPTMPLLIGAAYRLLGIHAPSAEAVLELLALVETFGGYLLLYFLFARLGVGRTARLGAFALLCLLPVYLGQEAFDFRYWEGALAVLLAAASLHLLVTRDAATGPTGVGRDAALAGSAVLTFFVGPALGLGVGLGCALLLATRAGWLERSRTIAFAGLFLLALFGPWTLRNVHAMGRPIVLRDNAPLELALANNGYAATLTPGEAYPRALETLHPAHGGFGTARAREIGELRYVDELDRAVRSWIARHPATFARLCLLHLREMLLPSDWEFALGSGGLRWERALLVSAVSVLGLGGLGRGLTAGPRGWRYVAIVAAVAVLSYLPFQPIPRYLYLIWGLLAFSAAALVDELAGRIKASGT